MGSEAKKAGAKLLKELRDAGISAEGDIMGRNMKKQLRHANAIGASKVLMIGDDELAQNSVTLKDMKTSEQVSLSMENVVEELTGK